MPRRRSTRWAKRSAPGEVGAAALWLARQQVAHDAQRVVAAAARGHVAFDAVGEDHAADAVVVGDSREGQHRRQLGGVVALAQVARAEILRARDVDQQQQREVALLDELLHVRRAHAGGDVPVDRAHLVAGRVLAHLGELHAAALEDRVVRPADPRLEDHPRADLDAPDLPEDLSGEHSSSEGGCAAPLRLPAPLGGVNPPRFAAAACGSTVPNPTFRACHARVNPPRFAAAACGSTVPNPTFRACHARVNPPRFAAAACGSTVPNPTFRACHALVNPPRFAAAACGSTVPNPTFRACHARVNPPRFAAAACGSTVPNPTFRACHARVNPPRFAAAACGSTVPPSGLR